MRTRLTATGLAVTMAFGLALSGCQDEGPAERMGRTIDEGAQEMGEAARQGAADVAAGAERTAEEARKAAEEARKAAEETVEDYE